MSVLDAIKGRRSIRRFTDKDIPDDVLHRILEAAQWAPSWANTQCWEIVAVREARQKKRLAETLSKKNPATLAARNAPVVLAVCGGLKKSGYYKGEAITKFGDWFLHDLGLATQNVVLAAHSLGLGSVIVGAFNHDKAKEILLLPEGYEAVSLIPMGYPDQTPKAPKRRAIEDFSHFDFF